MHSRAFFVVGTLALVAGCSPPPLVYESFDAGIRPDVIDPDARGPDADNWGTTAVPTFAPPPLVGGTLLVTRDGRFAVAADPARDQVSVVDLETNAVAHTIALEPGSEPGRLAEDGAGRVHVALRRTGQLATVDPVAGTVVTRAVGCAAPRGVAYDPRNELVHVACVDGSLVSLAAATGVVLRTTFVAPDLRDVVFDGARLYVTTFRRASLIEIGPRGEALPERLPADSFERGEGTPMTPSVAWRAVAMPAGGVLVAHQRGLASELPASSVNTGRASTSGAYGASSGAGPASPSCRDMPVVESTFTLAAAAGSLQVQPRLAFGAPTIDVAVRPTGDQIAFVSPGAQRFPRASQVRVYVRSHLGGGQPCVASDLRDLPIDGIATSATFAPDGSLYVLSHDPPQVSRHMPTTYGLVATIPLEGSRRNDEGLAIFHGSVGAGIACASCHPEGGDDGRVWRFSDGTARRTQTLRGGIRGTFPLHWEGAFSTMAALVEDTFEQRMGAHALTPSQTFALERWIDAIPALPVAAPSDASSVDRGRALFASPSVGCANCHSGARYTNNATVDVGTGEALQVPSLNGLVARAPYMHTGCARTLRERFTNTACGGATHGDVRGLSPSQLDDLVAYLQTL